MNTISRPKPERPIRFVASASRAAVGSIETDNTLYGCLFQKEPQQLAFAAAEVEHGLGGTGFQCRQHGPHTLFVQAQRLFDRLLFLIACFVVNLRGFVGRA